MLQRAAGLHVGQVDQVEVRVDAEEPAVGAACGGGCGGVESVGERAGEQKETRGEARHEGVVVSWCVVCKNVERRAGKGKRQLGADGRT